MSDRKYQIFISSTYEDLKDHRDHVAKAILEMGHIPVGMEMFSASDEDSWTLIRRQIDVSDYYVVVIAHRYGSMRPDNVSYTEAEYDYAVSVNVPTLGFILDVGVDWSPKMIDDDKAALERFKTKIKAKNVSFWTTPDSLRANVAIALLKQMTLKPRPGWIRGDAITDPKVTSEIARLSKENAELRKDRLPQIRLIPSKLKLFNSKESKRISGIDVTLFVHCESGGECSFLKDDVKAQIQDPNGTIQPRLRGLDGVENTGVVSGIIRHSGELTLYFRFQPSLADPAQCSFSLAISFIDRRYEPFLATWMFDGSGHNWEGRVVEVSGALSADSALLMRGHDHP